MTVNILPRSMVLGEFLPMVGQTMLADCSPKPVELTLVEAYALPDRGAVERPPFMLIFRSAPGIVLLTGIYAMRCGEFGPDLIQIGQVAPAIGAAPGNYYQAVFN